ncbi:helix-turn-helix domain-containing protein [Streptomyces sp. NPDC005492]|uniref:helix-turn-helix domain-containing protein n=1 Tax=Streptomyces sp. NPDC005492 TaxID=3156883 RepID=UPI0033BA9E8B
MRCRIILACATGASNKDVAEQVGSTPHAVGCWRARFVRYRIAGLGDMPRPGGPRTVTDDQVAAVVTKTLESTPKNATHWSTRSMAKEMGLSQSSVSRIWRRSACSRAGRRPSSCRRTGPTPRRAAVLHPAKGRQGPRRRHAPVGRGGPGPVLHGVPGGRGGAARSPSGRRRSSRS